MRRREFISALAGFSVLPARSDAQGRAGRPVVLGWLGAVSGVRSFKQSFEEGLRELGYVEGRDYVFVERFAGGVMSALPALAAELVSLRPDIIIAAATASVAAAKQATSDIPIVGPALTDPVDLGFIASHARPNSNITGVLSTTDSLPESSSLWAWN